MALPSFTSVLDPLPESQPTRLITLPAGTLLVVRLDQPLNTKYDLTGSPFDATLANDVVVNNQVVVPIGAHCTGVVTQSKKSGRFKGRAVMALSLDSVTLGGRVYGLATSSPEVLGGRHGTHNLKWIGGSTAGGAALGAIIGGGAGAAIGAGVGAAGGATGAALTSKRNVRVAPETLMAFTLTQPATLAEPELKASAPTPPKESNVVTETHHYIVTEEVQHVPANTSAPHAMVHTYHHTRAHVVHHAGTHVSHSYYSSARHTTIHRSHHNNATGVASRSSETDCRCTPSR